MNGRKNRGDSFVRPMSIRMLVLKVRTLSEMLNRIVDSSTLGMRTMYINRRVSMSQIMNSHAMVWVPIYI